MIPNDKIAVVTSDRFYSPREKMSTNHQTDLAIPQDARDCITRLSPEHDAMLQEVTRRMPEIQKDIAVFGRRQSQFMDSALTCSHPTPIRNLRQVLAEAHRAATALNEAAFTMRENDLKASIKEQAADKALPLKADLLRTRAARLRSQNADILHSVSGAIRKLRFLFDQRDAILKHIGKDRLTEADFEADEARYHVMKAFEQALCAAYAHGHIDEGNHIYLCQLGISGMMAQAEIKQRLSMEQSCIEKGLNPLPEAHHKWLESMADNYAGQAQQRIAQTGMICEPVYSALLTEGTNHE